MTEQQKLTETKPINRLLVANRGEVAIRIMRAAWECAIDTVAVYSDDDAQSLHLRHAGHAVALGAKGVPAYLDGARMIEIARETGCDAVHPGYGFLSENADFAEMCAENDITFVGPSAAALRLFGDKATARALAEKTGVPTVPGTAGPTDLAAAHAFFESAGAGGAMVIKAIAGGGGRGIRTVQDAAEIDDAHAACGREALAAFGNGDVYVERLIRRARHIEIQVVADQAGAVIDLGERECSLQRRHQKIVEIAPSPTLDGTMRDRLCEAARKLATAAGYSNIGTFEFLLDDDDPDFFAFMEANPRLQVEHTVTEEVTGIDLVQTQLQIAAGASLADLDLDDPSVRDPRGHAIQLRVNMETMMPDGTTRPAGGVLAAFDPPGGPGVRVDTFGYAGYRTSPAFDSLLAKVIVHVPGRDYGRAVQRAYQALCAFRIDGVASNIGFLQNLLRDDDVIANRVHTRFVDDHVARLAAPADGDGHQALYVRRGDGAPGGTARDGRGDVRRAGATVDSSDPLAILGVSQGSTATPAGPETGMAAIGDMDVPDGMAAVAAPMQGTIVSVDVAPGDAVYVGQPVMIMESMKMQHEIRAEISGIVQQVLVAAGDTLFEGSSLIFLTESAVDRPDDADGGDVDLDRIRPDLAEVIERHGFTLTENRPDAQEKRRKTNQRVMRENVLDLVDEDSFQEYGALTLAARRSRMDMDTLIRKSPADGLITGIGRVNGDRFSDDRARCAVVAYDYTVFAGTQGKRNHEKKDRMFNLAADHKLPLVVFSEGGGGRPGDVDWHGGLGSLVSPAFHYFAKLSGLVPLVCINSGRCFAGNAGLLGMSDVVIATKNSSIGMGGPAMIEGGGLGNFHPDEVGPMSVQVPNGVVDIAVEDEAEAVAVAKKYLSYFQGAVSEWDCADQRLLRNAVPEDRLRAYDMRNVIDLLADTDSVLEIRRGFGAGMITAFARVEGRPIGIVANNPNHLGGAIDTDGSDKASRFLQLCDAFDIPVLMLCDTPGMMVGPEVEKTALVRHCARTFVIGANMSVPIFTLVTRKGYGLGAQAMAGASFHAPAAIAAWPTGEFGGMGLEGAVKLGFRDVLAAIEDPAERLAKYEEMVAEQYQTGYAINYASHFQIDAVIDPKLTRKWLVDGLRAMPPVPVREGKKRPYVDTW